MFQARRQDLAKKKGVFFPTKHKQCNLGFMKSLEFHFKV